MIKISTKVKNAQGLRVGAAVHFKGIKVGSVHATKILSVKDILIVLKVKKKHSQWIKIDSYIDFRTQGVLGDKYLEILGGQANSQSIQNGDSLNSNENSQIDKIINEGEGMLVVAGRVLMKLDLLIGAIEPQRLKSTVQGFDKLMTRINKGPGSLHSFIYDPTIHEDLKLLLGGAQRSRVLKYFIRETIKENNQ